MSALLSRQQRILRTSFLGIAVNLSLAAAKALIGFWAGSIAIVLDAVNNLTDLLSSAVTILGVKLATRPADAKHPFGYGRIEYFTTIAIALLIFLTGVVSLSESFKKIIDPVPPEYSGWSVAVIVAAVFTKFFLGRHVKRVGEEVKSGALIASGTDAFFDAVISLGTLASIFVLWFFEYSLDGVVGLLIALVIIKAAYDLAATPVSELLGKRLSSQFSKEIKEDVLKFDGVEGVYDLIVHNYGPNLSLGQLHIEVLDTMTADEIHHLTQHIQKSLSEKYGIYTTIGIYAVNTKDPAVAAVEHRIRDIAASLPGILQTHAHHIDLDEHFISFDFVVDYCIADPRELHRQLLERLHAAFPDFDITANIDREYA